MDYINGHPKYSQLPNLLNFVLLDFVLLDFVSLNHGSAEDLVVN